MCIQTYIFTYMYINTGKHKEFAKIHFKSLNRIVGGDEYIQVRHVVVMYMYIDYVYIYVYVHVYVHVYMERQINR